MFGPLPGVGSSGAAAGCSIGCLEVPPKGERVAIKKKVSYRQLQKRISHARGVGVKGEGK